MAFIKDPEEMGLAESQQRMDQRALLAEVILTGFAISVRSTLARRTVTVIYTFALLWYTMLCRLPIFTSVPVVADSTAPSVETVTPSTAEKIMSLIVSVFGLQPDGTLADGGVIRSLVFSAILFVPMGYLVLIWLLQLL